MGLKQAYFTSRNLNKPFFKFRLKVRSEKEYHEVVDWFGKALSKCGGLSRPTELVIEHRKKRS